uniref:Protein kinase domain-containing protein n=1 Tax=Physcomitrium patens TaxID=3218 RepID=A0A7I4FD15_PHYPA
MCYLHDMQIAHQDLKPDNILLNFIDDGKFGNGFHYVVVKLIDFGCSKINVGRNPKVKENTHLYGTLRYIAPEILKSTMESTKICAFEVNVYSFAMTCYKILSGEDPFDGINTKKELLIKIEKGERPQLPSNYDGLNKLIEECWTLNPSRRPSFGDICKRLTTLKKKYLVGINIAKIPHFGAFKKDLERSKSKDVHVDDTLVVKSYPTKIHKFDIGELDKDASLKLFTAYSYRDGDELPKELIGIGKEIVTTCNSLPLSLKVLGSFLGGQKRLRCWERALQKLRRRSLDGDEIDSEYKLWTILKIIFDVMKVEEKNIFLDICCFFCNNVKWGGTMKETIIQIWTNKKSGVEEQDVSNVLDMLVHQSMIKVEKNGVIKVHDQLQDMGQKIVEEEKEYKDTRIWNANMVPMHGITTKIRLSNSGRLT